MIRLAVPSDKVSVIRLLAHSRAAAGFDRADGETTFNFPFDPAYAERLFLAHLVLDRLCLVLDVDGAAQGVLMAVALDHPFGPVRLARETVWWIEPHHRGPAALRMLELYENWARQQHCQFTGMAGLMVGAGGEPDVGVLYQRRGYRAAELHYLKVL